ncbi:MAG: RluA family pseudouridine synthase [Lentisphaerota bacterium]
MNKIIEIIVDERYDGERLDHFLACAIPEYSRSFFQKLIKSGKVKYGTVDSPETKCTVRKGIKVSIEMPVEEKKTILGEKIHLDVIYEDDDMLVVNKAPGMVVHPAAGNWDGTVVNALLGRDEEFAEKLEDGFRPGIVHRLDKDTSGCLIIAKNSSSQFQLAKLFQDRKIKKTYAAIVCGLPPKNADKIIAKIGRHPVNRKKMTVVHKGGRLAVTKYEVIKRGKIEKVPVCLLELQIETGRTHQIRAHLAYKHLPVLGDRIYGGKQVIEAPRQMLHAWKIAFPHPKTGEMMEIESPFPEDFIDMEHMIR